MRRKNCCINPAIRNVDFTKLVTNNNNKKQMGPMYYPVFYINED